MRRSADAGAAGVERLLEADSATDRSQAFEELLRLGQPALPTLARALERSAAGGLSGGHRSRNRAAAVELLARGGEARWLPPLRNLQKLEQLRPTLLQTRATPGEDEVAAELAALWLARLRRQMFLTRATQLVPSAAASTNQTVVQRIGSDTERCAEALRGLAESPDAPVLDNVLDARRGRWTST